MTNDKLPKRHAKRGWKIALCIALVFLAALGTFLIIKRETVSYVLHPEKIVIRSAGDMRERLQEGDFKITKETEGEIEYTAMDGSVNISVRTDGDTVTDMQAGFNAYDFEVNGVSDAMEYAKEILDPFYTESQIEAIVTVVAMDLPSYIGSDAVDYTRELGGYTLRADGSLSSGDIQVKAEHNS